MMTKTAAVVSTERETGKATAHSAELLERVNVEMDDFLATIFQDRDAEGPMEENVAEGSEEQRTKEPLPIVTFPPTKEQFKKAKRLDSSSSEDDDSSDDNDGHNSSSNEEDPSSQKSASPRPSTSRVVNNRKRRVRFVDNSEDTDSSSSKTKTAQRRRIRRSMESSGSSERSSKSASDSETSCSSGRGQPRKRTRRVTSGTKLQEKALAKLCKKRKHFASKPVRQSPVREKEKPSVEEEEEGGEDDKRRSSSSSSSSSGPPSDIDDFVVPDDAPIYSDFGGSTPSSSSVTSSGETEEEPDLEIGGNEGEKDIKEEDIVSSGNDDEEEEEAQHEEGCPCCSESSEDEPPDDGDDDPRCILCKSLGSQKIVGRAVEGNTKSWCKCGHCEIFTPLVGDYDLICCREIKGVVDFIDEELDESTSCITKHPRFQQDVLQNEGYARSISKHRGAKRFAWSFNGQFFEYYSAGKGDENLKEKVKQEFKESPRYTKLWKSLSSYTHWIFDKMGKEARLMVIPACVQSKVRDEFRIDPAFFNRFAVHSKQVCGTGDAHTHCRLSRKCF